MKCVNLKDVSTDAILKLFCDCFAEDTYYARLFVNPATRKEEMYNRFKLGIEFCAKSGISYGIETNGELAAFILCFDYIKTRNEAASVFLTSLAVQNRLMKSCQILKNCMQNFLPVHA